MTLPDARNILGLGPDDDLRQHLAQYHAARERIAEMVRHAPNEQLAIRYQQSLVEFDQALAAVREHFEQLDAQATIHHEPEEVPAEGKQEPCRKSQAWLVWLLVVLTVAGGGVLYHHHIRENQRRIVERIDSLNRQGQILLENRRWQEATRVFGQIEKLEPCSETALRGQHAIVAGMQEEQKQFIGYWTGQAIAELESGRLDEAEAAARRVLQNFPDEREAAAILVSVDKARAGMTRIKAIATARRLLGGREWELAANAARKLLDADPADNEAAAILADANAAIEKQRADQARAEELFRLASERDQGVFDQQALDWLREAATLAPANPQITALLEKMASYTRTLRVPGDFATPAEALEAARDRDRIVLGEQTWKGPLVINAAIELQGAGSAATIIECPPMQGCPITIGPDAKGARITGITFRHESFLADGRERFAAALVRGGGAIFVDCHFMDASGHGLAVIESGEVIAHRCRFAQNGWNGAAAIGAGSYLEVRDSESFNNFEHGIESWEGGAVTLVNNRCEGNSRNGIHADNGAAAAVIEGNQLIANREFGLVLGSAGSGKISGNTARENLLGGFVILHNARALAVTQNQATLNRGPGIVLEKGLSTDAYGSNISTRNTGSQVVIDADLSTRE